MKKLKRSDVPVFIIKLSKHWWKDTVSGQFIRTDKIDDYLNKHRDKEIKPVKEYWWNKD